MHIQNRFKEQKRWYPALLIFAVFLNASVALAGEMWSTICRNEVVSAGDRKGEVLTKCGPPLSKSQDGEETRVSETGAKKKTVKKQVNNKKTATKVKKSKERAETWTYNIDGAYRFFVFKEGRLDRIETGGLVD